MAKKSFSFRKKGSRVNFEQELKTLGPGLRRDDDSGRCAGRWKAVVSWRIEGET
jgi:hypothetical protein